MKKVYCKLAVLTVLLFLFTFATAQVVIWEEDFNPPLTGWELEGNWSFTIDYLRLYFSPSQPNYDWSAISPEITLPADVGDLIVTQHYSNFSAVDEVLEIIVIHGAEETVVWSYNCNQGTFPEADFEISLIPFSGEVIQLKFRSHGSDSWNINWWDIYNLAIMGSVDDDLAALSLTGNSTPSINTPTNYTMMIRNNGVNTQTDYVVRLMEEGDIELISIDGLPIEFGEEIEYVFNHTFSSLGPTTIWGEVVLDGDEIPGNNLTNVLNINVQEEGLVAVTVGTATTSANLLPLNFFWRNSISQVIYMSEELNVGGMLTGIMYYSNFVTNLTNMPVRIWVAETQQDNLTANWLPLTEFTQVFDGVLDFPSGQNEILIPFDEYVPYGGDNLVIMANRVMDTTYYSSLDHFYYTETPEYQNRARYMQSDSIEYDPANLTGGTLASRVPNTTLFFAVAGMGSLEGYVYDEDNNPMGGVEIGVQQTNFTQISSPDGYFHFPYVFEGTFDVIASIHGFYDTIIEDVLIEEGETTEIVVNMVQLPNVTVSGLVVGSDFPDIGIPGAFVQLSGYESYAAETNAEGIFEIDGVYADQTYSLVAGYEGYTNYVGEVVVGNVDLDIGTVVLDEIAFPPSHLVATITPDGNSVDLIWNSPGSGILTEFRYDDGIVDEQLGFGGGSVDYVLGAVHRNEAEIHEITWVTTEEGGPHNSVHVYVFGLNDSGLPDGSQLLYHAPDVPNVDNEWNVHVLPEPVEAPNGFLIGLGYAGFLGLATDDGVGDPWQFQFNTQFAVAGYATAVWTPIEEYGFEVSFLIRALGYDFGEIDYRFSDVDSVSPLTGNSEQERPGRGFNLNRNLVVGEPGYINSSRLDPVINRRSLSGVENSIHSYENRVFENFRIFRFLHEDTGEPDNWIEVANVTDTTYTDPGWQAVPEGYYRYAVRAVHTNEVLSAPAISNWLAKGMTASVTVNLTTDVGDSAAGAVVTMYCQELDPDGNYPVYVQTATGDDPATAYFNHILQGFYNIEIVFPGFTTYTQADIDVTQDLVLDIEIIEFPYPPVNLMYTAASNIVNLMWSPPVIPVRGLEEIASEAAYLEDMARQGLISKDEVSRIIERMTNDNFLDMPSRALLGYNVYRDGLQINTDIITSTNYTDTDVVNNEPYTYYVTAVYTLSESEPSNSVTAVPGPQQLIVIGEGTTVANTLPFNFWWRNSLSQTIYMQNEINAAGIIMELQYFNNFTTNLPNMPVRIWMGETTQTNLSGGWIPATELELVFEGTVDFPSGSNTISIQLDDFFLYTGASNLVIMANRPMDTTYYSSLDQFYYTETAHANRSLNMQSDSIDFDPYNPTGGTLTNRVPNTGLNIITAGMGTLTGYVRDVDNQPIANATVSVLETPFQTQTGNDGQYFFAFVFEGEQEVQASAHGYYDSIDTIEVIENETVELDFTLLELPMVTVIGTVVGSDYPDVGLGGAVITLTGYSPYETETDAQGNFTINNVYADHTYNMNIVYPGYTTHQAEVAVGNVDLDLGTIILNEIAFPPSNVVAELDIENNLVNVHWQSPGTAVSAEFRYDDGIVDEQLGFGGGTVNHVLGAVHRHEAEIHEITWVTTSEGGPHNSVHVYIFGLNAAGQPDSNQLLYLAPNVANTDNAWITHELPEPVDAPNGFLVGLGYNGFLGLATDDGVGDPWAFVPGTQYGVADYNTGVWTPIEQWGFQVNYLLRAYGFDYGPINYRNSDLVYMPDSQNVNNSERLTTGNSHGRRFSGEPVYNRSTRFLPSDRAQNFALRNDFTGSRLLEEYTVFRLAMGQENNENLWTELASVQDTVYVDTDFVNLDAGVYRYAIKAVYTNNVLSDPAFSNSVAHDMYCQVTINITTNSGDSPAGAVVNLINQTLPDEFSYSLTAPASGIVIFPEIWKGIYTVEVNLGGFYPFTEENVDFTENVTVFNVQLIEQHLPVVNLEWSVEGNNVTLSWDEPGTPLGEPWFEDFESGLFPPEGWITLSPDGGSGWEQLAVGTTPLPGWTGGEAIAAPDGGNFMAYCTWTTGGANSNDQWLISPQLLSVEGFEITFYLRYWPDSYSDYVEILISTGEQNNVNDFNIVVDELSFGTGSSTDWELYSYNLTDFVSSGESFYLAFRETVADNINEGAAIMLDNVYVGPVSVRNTLVSRMVHEPSGERADFCRKQNLALNAERGTNTTNQRALLGYKIIRNGVIIEEFHQNLNYVDLNLPPDLYVYGVVAQYSTGESETVETDEIIISSTEEMVPVDYKTTLKGNYPNPFNPYTIISFSLEEFTHVTIEIFNVKGQKIATVLDEPKPAGNYDLRWDGRTDSGIATGSGILFYKMKAGEYSAIKKMILLK